MLRHKWAGSTEVSHTAGAIAYHQEMLLPPANLPAYTIKKNNNEVG